MREAVRRIFVEMPQGLGPWGLGSVVWGLTWGLGHLALGEERRKPVKAFVGFGECVPSTAGTAKPQNKDPPVENMEW